MIWITLGIYALAALALWSWTHHSSFERYVAPVIGAIGLTIGTAMSWVLFVVIMGVLILPWLWFLGELLATLLN